jgi:RES domain-containing protein
LDLRRCSALGCGPIVATWYRAVDPAFLATAISTKHTPTITTRFSPGTKAKPAFEILYLAENPMVALFEANALYGSPTKPGGVVPNPARGLVTMNISVKVLDIVDLTDPGEAGLLATNAQELTGDWLSFSNRPGGPPHAGKAPTQQLGEELFRLGTYKGFVSFSAKLPDYRILGVFTGRLVPGNDEITYSYHDGHGVLQKITIP